MTLSQTLTIIIEIASEKLTEDKQKEFSDIVTAAADGKDLSVIHWQFLAAELSALSNRLPIHIQDVVDLTIIGMDLLSAGKAWKDAAEVAKIADAIAQSSTYTAVAAVATYAAAAAAAHTATVQASCIAYATGVAALAAAESSSHAKAYAKTRQRQRGLLLSLIKRAPVGTDQLSI